MGTVRCTYCGRRGGALLEADLRGVRYDYCDAACATAHRMAVELTAMFCRDCDTDAAADTGLCPGPPEVVAPALAADPGRTGRGAACLPPRRHVSGCSRVPPV